MIDQSERIAALNALAALRERGALTDDEFAAEKARLLNTDSAASSEPAFPPPRSTQVPPSPPSVRDASRAGGGTGAAASWFGDPRRRRLLLVAAAIVGVIGLAIVGASRKSEDANPSVRSPAVPSPGLTTAANADEPPMTAAADSANPLMPSVVCMNLQDAQDLIQEHGVWLSLSEDATGRDRNQIIDSNWIVVGQTPAPGTPFGEGEAVLAVVKLDEPNPC